MPSLTVSMVKDRETKGAVRYQEVDDNGQLIGDVRLAKVGILYLRKSTFGRGLPSTIALTVSW